MQFILKVWVDFKYCQYTVTLFGIVVMELQRALESIESSDSQTSVTSEHP